MSEDETAVSIPQGRDESDVSFAIFSLNFGSEKTHLLLSLKISSFNLNSIPSRFSALSDNVSVVFGADPSRRTKGLELIITVK